MAHPATATEAATIVAHDVRHDFRPRDFVGGHPVVDFVNTVTARNATPIDWLDDYGALLRWAAGSGLCTAAELPAIDSSKPAAAAELRRCKDLREALHAILCALADGHAVAATAANVLQAQWKLAASAVHVDLSTTPVRLRHAAGRSELTFLRRTLAFAAVDFLTTVNPDRVRICPGPHCGWLFIDGSKPGRRRWCDMATCGTAAKSRRRREARGSG
jgi:predicted RNA-binding Zn ribbon-like protein